MAPCQDKAPTRPWHEIEKLFSEEFGHGVDYYFSSFEYTPIAAASLAQVYKARLHDGTLVAVKVQYPQLQEQVKHDTRTFERLIAIAEYFFSDIKLQWLVDEFKRTIPHELNFLEEGQNCQKLDNMIKNSFRGRVKCPKVYWECTSSRVLTLEFVEGVKVNDRIGLSQLQADAAQVSQLLTEVFCEQIFLNGFVHCDPHPGNILVRRDPQNSNNIQLVILDHGLYLEIDSEFRADYAYLWKGIVERDEKTIREYAKKLGIDNYELFTIMLTARSFDMNDVGMQTEMSKEVSKKLKQYGQENFSLITQVLSDVNRKTLLLLKCNDLLRGVQKDLGIPVNYFVVFAKYATRGINRARLESPNASIFTYISCMKDYAKLSLKLKLFLYYQWIMDIYTRFTNALRVGVQTFYKPTKEEMKKNKKVLAAATV
jgi:aarF domain-containing kinase